MSGGKKLLFTFVLAAVAFVYQYVRSPSFRRQCGSVFAEWRGNAPSHTPRRLAVLPLSLGECRRGAANGTILIWACRGSAIR